MRLVRWLEERFVLLVVCRAVEGRVSDGSPPAPSVVTVPVRLTAQGHDRVTALLAISGETIERFIALAIAREVETREAARDFRRALDLRAPALPAPRPSSTGSSTPILDALVAARPASNGDPIDPLALPIQEGA